MADTKKYLDLAGLRIYDTAIKNYIENKIEAINGSIANIDTITTYATVSYNAWNKFLAGINIAEPTPTLKTISDNFTSINNTLANKADKATTLAGYGITDAYTKTEVDGLITNATTDKADKATTLAGYGITDAYTKTEVDDKITVINNAISGGTHFIGVLGSLDGITLKSGDIFVASSDFGNFKKDLEYIYDGTNWYELGDSSANAAAISGLESNKANKSDVYTKGEIDGKVTTINNSINTKADASALNNYVQKDGNKVLSDVNFSQADKTKLDGLANIKTVTTGDVLKLSDGTLSVDMSSYSTTTDVEGLITNATNASGVKWSEITAISESDITALFNDSGE